MGDDTWCSAVTENVTTVEVDLMKCVDYPHFKILYDPIEKALEILDLRRAKCEKQKKGRE